MHVSKGTGSLDHSIEANFISLALADILKNASISLLNI